MALKGMAILGALTALVFAAVLMYVLQEQRQQAQELARLKKCVSILERNQVTPQTVIMQGTPQTVIMQCPIYN